MLVPWTRQPPGTTFVGLDPQNPLAQGIVGGIDARGFSLVGRGVTRVGTINAVAPRPGGIALIGNNAGLFSEQFPSSGAIDYPFTVVAVMSRITRTANGNLLGGLGNNAGSQLAVFQCSSAGGASNRFIYRNVNAGNSPARNYSANAATSTDAPVVLSATISGVNASDIAVYWNGADDSGTAINSPTTGAPSFDRLALGGVDRSTDGFADTGNDVLLCFVTSKGWTAKEHFNYAKNPWQIFRPIVVPVKAPASGGTDYPVTQTEAATGSDTTSCLIGYAPAATEAGSASDAASAAMAAVVAIIEAASATSSEAAVTARQAAITESATATDTTNGTASGDYTATITEAAGASSLEAAVSNYLAAISESASASDSASASLPGEYSVSISEAASAIETAVCAMSALVTINEAAAAADASNWVGAITFTRAPRGSGYPGTPPTTTRPGQTNTARPKMANTRR